ncbi:iron ABC transporter permease [Corynebacterium diphtheriae]|nr:iron chelate uptake ABC transporter family permease subunit [Corynebacterium diphtheriae]CAB1024102.1 iron ABC transporter permease [Corynebacterium diphtheriae]
MTGRGFDIIVPALLPLGVGALLALAMGPTLNVLNLGAEAAQALGTNVGRANALGLVAITLLAGAATAAAGPIGFVGLVVPHVARSITGPDYKWVLPYSGLAGACLLLLADIIGRLVMRPGELQAGIVIALIGAPAFIWLVRHRKLVSI